VEPVEGGDEIGGPGPALGDAECAAPAAGDELGGGMQEAVAEPFGFGSGEVAVEGEVVGPGEEILRHADDGEPCLVDGEAGRGQVGEPEVFGVADRSFGSPSAAVEGFEVGDVIVVEVGDHQLEAVAVDVGEGELRAGMWVFAAGDHPGRGRPSGQVDQSGDLGDLGSFSFVAAVGGDSWPPAAIGQSGNDRGELGGEAMPDDEPDLALAAGIQEAVGQPGGIGAGDHLRGRHRQLGEGGVEHRYVIGSGAGAPIPPARWGWWASPAAGPRGRPPRA
jgi:hypothetical protein